MPILQVSRNAEASYMPGQTVAETTKTGQVTSEGHNTMASAELTITADGLHDLLNTANGVSGDQTTTRPSAENSVTRKKPCPALDFEQLKLRLGQLTAPKKSKPDPGVEIPDGKELASVRIIEQTDLSQPTKGIIFPSAPILPGFPPVGAQPVLDPHQLYAYLNALQSQVQLSPLDLLLLSAIQQGQHMVSYNDLYGQLLQQQAYAGSSHPGFGRISPSLAVNPSSFLLLQNPMFASLAFDWQMAAMLAGLHGSSQTMMFAANQPPPVPGTTQNSIPDATPCDSEASSTPPLVKTVINSIAERRQQLVSVSEYNEIRLQNATFDSLSTPLNTVENKQTEDTGTLVHNGKPGIQPCAPSSSQTLTAVSTVNIPPLIFSC